MSIQPSRVAFSLVAFTRLLIRAFWNDATRRYYWCESPSEPPSWGLTIVWALGRRLSKDFTCPCMNRSWRHHLWDSSNVLHVPMFQLYQERNSTTRYGRVYPQHIELLRTPTKCNPHKMKQQRWHRWSTRMSETFATASTTWRYGGLTSLQCCEFIITSSPWIHLRNFVYRSPT